MMRNIWNSLQFKIPAVFIFSFLLILGAIFGVFSTVGRGQIEQQAYKEVVLSGRNIVSELGKRVALAESLATAVANLGEKLPADQIMARRMIRGLIDYEGTESFIAGGGLWPEPYQYDPEIERHSFFWGRDSQGILQYYDDYNNREGPGYHHEEWYVPARYLREGEAFWSKSYMDPYSYQPMVTVTAPMYRAGRFFGASTIDLKLEGLNDFLQEISRAYGGYAFALDRNGKFLSFPDEKLTKVYARDDAGGRTEEFITAAELAEKQPSFASMSNAIRSSISAVIRQAEMQDTSLQSLAARIAADSYQIDGNEARLIAAVLASGKERQRNAGGPFTEVFVENDFILGESAYAAVFEMPGTHWKIVTVMPDSMATRTSNEIYGKLLISTLLAMSVSLVIMLFIVRKVLVKPIAEMSGQLQALAQAGDSEAGQLEVRDKGELGRLAYWFNRRSTRLQQAQTALRAARDELEQRVSERTEALRDEIDRRERAQRARDMQVARVERQHAALVDLSLHRAVFEGGVAGAARVITEAATEVMDVERCSILLIDEAGEFLVAVDLYDRESGAHEANLKLRMEAYPAYIKALEHDRSIAISNVFEDPRTAELADYAETYGVVALLDSALRVGGKLQGVVRMEHTGEEREWQADEVRFSGEVADQFLQVLANAERVENEEKIRQLAFYDPLTELANRRLLQETMGHDIEVARRQGKYGSLLYLDLDNFKTLNDSLGHHIGDELLIQVAARLRSVLRKEDTASRLGGDEFVILLTAENDTRQQSMEQALRVAEKIHASLSRPYRLKGYEHVVSASMGITLYPNRDDTVTDILKQADTAMYRAKASGRGSVSFYDPEMQEEADIRLAQEKELRRALGNGEFELYYQPLVDQPGNAIGCEALVRWNHPEKGLVCPAAFIPMAEETGLILDLGQWALTEACRFCERAVLSHVAVNISPLQFRQLGFVGMVRSVLEATGANPGFLTIELTEGIVIENTEDTIVKMASLKEMGIRIAIDDFGTGYSSLSYLKRLPLDQLKINNDFVRDINSDPNDAIIVETIISMARHLGLDVVAEGVETAEQLAFLSARGCHLYQGYYFSRPLAESEIDLYLAERGMQRFTR